jgi:hypothetical protein
MSMLSVAMTTTRDHMAASVEDDEMDFWFINCTCGVSTEHAPDVDIAIDMHVAHVMSEFIEKFKEPE